MSDINAGLAYRETYKKLIEPEPMASNGRHKVLIPVIPCMDSRVTGHGANMPLETMKFTLGLDRVGHPAWWQAGSQAPGNDSHTFRPQGEV